MRGILLFQSQTDSNLEQFLNATCSVIERLKGLQNKTMTLEEKMEEIRLVNRAKWALIKACSMTEEDARSCLGTFFAPAVRRGIPWTAAFGDGERKTGLDDETLDRLFATELSTTVGRETLRQRLVQARVMLQAHALSISEIASQTGFSSPAHLSHAFKAAFGLSPREYRNG